MRRGKDKVLIISLPTSHFPLCPITMFHFRNLISKQYLFQISYTGLSRSDKEFLLLGALALVFAVMFKFAAVFSPTPVDKKYRNRLFNLLLTVGLWELVWFLLRSQDIIFFGTHFVALLGLLIGLIWLAMIVSSMFKSYSSEKQTWEKEQVRLRYLPR